MSLARSAPRALAALVLSLALTACPSLAPRGEGPPSVERAERLERQGDAAAAARVYEALANENAGTERVAFAHRAAQAWLRARLPAEAERVLREVSGDTRTPPQSFERSLLEVEIALARGQGVQAWQALAAVAQPAAAPEAARYLELKERAAFASNRPLEGVRAAMALDQVLAASQRATARIRLLGELRTAAERGVKIEPAEAADPIARGWLELGPLAAEAARNPLGAAGAIERWRRRYPGHPAAGIVRQELLGEQAGAGKPGFEPAAHVALLLPVSGRMAGAAAAIRDGFLTAYYQAPADTRMRLRIYDTNEGSVDEVIAQAAAGGARFIVGPLTRDEAGVAADYAGSRPPLLALNFLPPGRSAPPRFFQFALSPEDEARAVARRALASGQRRGIALVPTGDWGNRVLEAFREELLAGGGTLLTEVRYDTLGNDYSEWITQALRLADSRARHRRLEQILGTDLAFEPRRRGDIEFVFAPAPFDVARLMRPQLRFHYAGGIPTYATSDAHEPEGQGSMDMEGLMFPDMPWMLGSGALTAEVRAETQAAWGEHGSARRTRLFAFGYDAYRLMTALSEQRLVLGAELEGLTGRLALDELGRIHRELEWARLQGGEARLLPPIP